MPDTLEELRAKARAHQLTIDAETHGLTPRRLAARWSCSVDSVLDIPADRLPWYPIGRGTQRVHRRYRLADVERYESSFGRPAAPGAAGNAA